MPTKRDGKIRIGTVVRKKGSWQLWVVTKNLGKVEFSFSDAHYRCLIQNKEGWETGVACKDLVIVNRRKRAEK